MINEEPEEQCSCITPLSAGHVTLDCPHSSLVCNVSLLHAYSVVCLLSIMAIPARCRELEALPPSSGYLTGDLYVGTNQNKHSHTLAVLFWRSYDDLLRYSHASEQLHKPGERSVRGHTRWKAIALLDYRCSQINTQTAKPKANPITAPPAPGPGCFQHTMRCSVHACLVVWKRRFIDVAPPMTLLSLLSSRTPAAQDAFGI